MTAPYETEIDLSAELLRKGLHLGALAIPLGMLHIDRTPALFALGVITIAAFSMDLARARFPAVASLVHGLFGKLMRPREIPRPENAVVINGSTWVLAGSFLLLLIFPERIAAFVLVIFLVGDAAAGVVGRKYGRRSWRISDHTVEGTAAFLAVSLPASFFMPGIEPWIGISAAIFASAAEILPGPFNDNLQVPLATAGIVTLLEWLAPTLSW